MLTLPAVGGCRPIVVDRNYRLAVTLCRIAIALALAVILLGGWTRLNDAGLSCPDWPGCYGEMILPNSAEGLALAQARYQSLPLDLSRGWLEMGHRYLAGTLGLLIAALALIGWRQRRQVGYPFGLSGVLLGLVTLQALFGMWTVTLKLLPQVVTLHLLGGLLTLMLLLRLQQRLQRRLQQQDRSSQQTTNRGLGEPDCNTKNSPLSARGSCRRWVGLGLLLLLIQIGLGGWTSANYAGWACSHWLGCQVSTTDQAPLALDYNRGFSLPALGAVTSAHGYQGGLLPRSARAAIQMVHRLMAVIVVLYLLVLAAVLLRDRHRSKSYQPTLLLLVSLLVGQLLLGVFNVQMGLPLALAFGHHLGAVLLMVTMMRLYGLTERVVGPHISCRRTSPLQDYDRQKNPRESTLQTGETVYGSTSS